MKRSKQCPKCESRRIGHLDFQPDANDVVALRGNEEQADRTAHIASSDQVIMRALGISRDPTLLSGLSFAWAFYGRLEAYVCADCGFHETYVADAKSVDWERLQGFAWVNPDAPRAGPFR
jgi:predicted nucleic-acid-binding Zn-ribbon protein